MGRESRWMTWVIAESAREQPALAFGRGWRRAHRASLRRAVGMNPAGRTAALRPVPPAETVRSASGRFVTV